MFRREIGVQSRNVSLLCILLLHNCASQTQSVLLEINEGIDIIASLCLCGLCSGFFDLCSKMLRNGYGILPANNIQSLCGQRVLS